MKQNLQAKFSKFKINCPLALALKLSILITCAGCETVAPWERGNLAKPQMALNQQGFDLAALRHAYMSKQSATGGAGLGGGGCGCN
jgi:hypothetical protein